MSSQQEFGTQRRSGDRRRTYNRRRDDAEVSPPYWETFDRIASALERIEGLLRARVASSVADPPRVEDDPAGGPARPA